MRNFILGLTVGLLLSAAIGYAQFSDSSHSKGLTLDQQQYLFNLQQQLHAMPHPEGQSPVLVPVLPPC